MRVNCNSPSLELGEAPLIFLKYHFFPYSSWLEKPELIKNLESSLSGWKEEITALLSALQEALQVPLAAFTKDIKDTLLCSKVCNRFSHYITNWCKEDINVGKKLKLLLKLFDSYETAMAVHF